MKRALLTLGGLALIVVLLVYVAAWIGLRREERLYRHLTEEVFDGLEPSARFPPTERNATAHAVEALGAELGLDFSTKYLDAPMPRAEAAERWQEAKELAQEHLRAVVSSVASEAPVPDLLLSEFLEHGKGALARARNRLLAGEPPSWGVDLEAGIGGLLPNYVAQMDFHRLLLIASLEAGRQGEERAAEDFLEAAWRLRRGAADNPLVIAQFVRYWQMGGELSVLRRLCPADARWSARLAAPDLRSEALRSVQLEAWMVQHSARAGLLMADEAVAEEDRNPGLQRLLVLHHGEALQHAVERLRVQDPLTFDSRSFFDEQLERIPRWSRLSRIFLPNLFDVWLKAVRTELVVEHTERVLQACELVARGESPPADRVPSRAVPELSWVTQVDPAQVRISLDGDLDDGGQHPVALDYRMARGPSP